MVSVRPKTLADPLDLDAAGEVIRDLVEQEKITQKSSFEREERLWLFLKHYLSEDCKGSRGSSSFFTWPWPAVVDLSVRSM